MPDLNAARAQLEKLISFDTTSHLSNLALIAYAEDVLRAAGAETWRVANADGDKANLYALIGPDAPGGVVLSGHTDVVPVDGQAWSSDPWTLTERDGRLYGRGSCDMKGFLACALAAAPDFAAASLKRPIAFALSYDEEIGCIGAPSMIARLKDDLPALEAVIVGEPTEMKVVTAHKGLLSFRVTFTGREAHSSQVLTGVCAVTAAIPFANALVSLAKDLRANAPADTAFDPPFTTLTVGQFHGGTASNILAGQTVIETLARPCPWDDAEEMEAHIRAKAAEVEAEMQKIAPEARVDVHRMSHVPALSPEIDGAAERLARSITGDNATHVVAYGAEAGQFQQAGLSTVICGPGSIEQAHQPDEYISLDQLARGAAFMDKLAARLSA